MLGLRNAVLRIAMALCALAAGAPAASLAAEPPDEGTGDAPLRQAEGDPTDAESDAENEAAAARFGFQGVADIMSGEPAHSSAAAWREGMTARLPRLIETRRSDAGRAHAPLTNLIAYRHRYPGLPIFRSSTDTAGQLGAERQGWYVADLARRAEYLRRLVEWSQPPRDERWIVPPQPGEDRGDPPPWFQAEPHWEMSVVEQHAPHAGAWVTAAQRADDSLAAAHRLGELLRETSVADTLPVEPPTAEADLVLEGLPIRMPPRGPPAIVRLDDGSRWVRAPSGVFAAEGLAFWHDWVPELENGVPTTGEPAQPVRLGRRSFLISTTGPARLLEWAGEGLPFIELDRRGREEFGQLARAALAQIEAASRGDEDPCDGP